MSDSLFIMLVGLAGSGKSTYAKQRQKEIDGCIILSSDKIREELYGDESIQRDHVKVFQIMERRALDAARMGKSVIYDATDLSARRRKHMIRQMSAQGCSTECVICVATFEVCCKRQLTRERKVPTEVIHRQYCSFEIPTSMEGWDKITVWAPEAGGFVSLYDEIDKCKIPHDCKFHTLSVYEHMCAAYKIFQEKYSKQFSDKIGYITAKAVLYHDIGKAATKSFVDARGKLGTEAHYYSHENVGAWDILCASRSFIDMDDCLKCAQLVGLHMKMYQEVWYGRMYRHFFLEGTAETIEFWRALRVLHMCDVEAH